MREKIEAPEKIYAMPDLEGFWCDEKQNNNDIEYILADIVVGVLEEITARAYYIKDDAGIYNYASEKLKIYKGE